MNTNSTHSDITIRRSAFVVALGLHLVLFGVAFLITLQEPEVQQSAQNVEIILETPISPEIREPSQAGVQGKTNARSRAKAPSMPSAFIDPPAAPPPLADVPVTDAQKSDLQEHISQDLLKSMSEEEAFDSLMVLLEEYPEFRETVLRKMVAGKGIDRLPDLYESTGIKRLQMEMEFKTKYEYEAMRQWANYGPYTDPVHGPWGYKKTGPQVNVIELYRWLVDLIEGK